MKILSYELLGIFVIVVLELYQITQKRKMEKNIETILKNMK